MTELFVPDQRIYQPELMWPGREPVGPVELNAEESRGLVGRWLFNEGAGNTVYDLSKGSPAELRNGATWDIDPKLKKVIRLNAIGGDIRFTNGITFAPGSDFTFRLKLRPLSWGGPNPGLWRSGSTSTGSSWNIFQGSTGLPWIRWYGADILKPANGFGVPLNEVSDIDCVIKSGSWVGFYVNGELKHSATHTVNTKSFTVYNLGWQYTSMERVEGLYGNTEFLSIALSAEEIWQLYTNPYQDLQPRRIWVPVGGVAGEIIKTISDTSIGSDQIANLQVSLGINDTASGTDSAPGANVASLVSDAAVGTDALSDLAVIANVIDAATGLDNIPGANVALTLSDAGSGADTISTVSVTLLLGDNAIGADSVSVLSEVLKTISDFGAGADGVGINASLAVSDVAAGVDQPAITVSVALTDTAAGADAISLLTAVLKTVSDLAAAVETLGMVVHVPVSDAAIASDATSIAAQLQLSDVAAGSDSETTSAQVPVADIASGADQITSPSVSLQVSDAATGTELPPSVAAMVKVLESADATDIVVQFVPGSDVASIHFTLKSRAIHFTLH